MTTVSEETTMPSHHQKNPAGGSTRALRVGELVRHAVAEIFAQGGVHDPVLETHLFLMAGLDLAE